MEPFKRDTLETMAANLKAAITDIEAMQDELIDNMNTDKATLIRNEIDETRNEAKVLASQIAEEIDK